MRRIATRVAGWFVLFGLLAAGPSMADPSTAGPATAKPGMGEGSLIRGLNGGEYAPYRAAVVRQVQDALRQAGLYAGSTNGMLDEATMQALAEFQKRQGIVVSGIPTPRTRAELLSEQQKLASTTPARAPAPSATRQTPAAPAPVAAPPPTTRPSPPSAPPSSPMQGSTPKS